MFENEPNFAKTDTLFKNTFSNEKRNDDTQIKKVHTSILQISLFAAATFSRIELQTIQ